VLINWLTARLRVAIHRLEVARAEVEVAGRGRDEFVAAAAHDLKSPLAGISMAAQLARRRIKRTQLDGLTLEAVVSSLDDIENDAVRISGLLDDLLDMVHLQAGRPLPMRLQRMRLLDVVEPLAAAYASVSQSHEIKVMQLADPVGMWDARRLTRVLDNLLSNAVKYSPRGGQISLTVREDCSPDGRRMASVQVRDCGVGIPAADMPQIFERFFRARNVEPIAGSGIGLAGARTIVEQHGGSLTAESREGAGSTFTLQLPLGS
jgi:signal transduction histidine kinase